MRELDTGTDALFGHVDDGVAVITMNRPERRNAFSQDMLDALARALADVETADDVGCVVLTGAGGAFSAGGDVKAMADRGASPGRAVTIDAGIHRQRLNQQATSGKLWRMPKPTIASIPGPAAGAGFALALSCDFRYAADTAIFTTAFARVGFAGDYGGGWFLTQLVGPSRAKELYFLSERFGAEEAERLGLVNAVFPADKLTDEVLDRARKLATGPAVAYRYMKENFNRAPRVSLDDYMDVEVTHHVHTGLTEDHREAAAAFVEKREPRFSGR